MNETNQKKNEAKNELERWMKEAKKKKKTATSEYREQVINGWPAEKERAQNANTAMTLSWKPYYY